MKQNKPIISITNARVHNLKGVSLDLPKYAFIVFTGLSGSGKSSLAFDTIYAEGQRRYMESLSSYARQFLNQMDKPDVERIEGLSPAISIDQKSASHNPRSTVGTITEIYDYYRLFFSSIGVPHCPLSNTPMQRMSIQEIVEQAFHQFDGSSILILAPIIRNQKGEFVQLFSGLVQSGFTRVRIDAEIYRLTEVPKLQKYKPHFIDIVVDRLTVNDENRGRLTESIETALKQAHGLVVLETKGGDTQKLFSEHLYSPATDTSYPEFSHRSFSFNSPIGACSYCNGLGAILDFDPDLVLPYPDKPLKNAFGKIVNLNGTIWGRKVQEVGYTHGFDLGDRFCDLSDAQQNTILYGQATSLADKPFHNRSAKPNRWGKRYKVRGWEGLINILRRLHFETTSSNRRFQFRHYMHEKSCPTCQGGRLNQMALHVKIGAHTIQDLVEMPINAALSFFDALSLSDHDAQITQLIRREITERLTFLNQVGLGYLSLSRKAGTLSGGEFQRIRLATQIGVGLTGVLYVMDEPSIGLHQRDNLRLIESLKRLRDLGNTLIVVEHDEETIRQSDFIVDIGPRAGHDGGEIVFAGPLKQLLKAPTSITAKYLNGVQKIATPTQRRKVNPDKMLTIYGATAHNLKNITVSFPIHHMICVSGVSGSGKSTLVIDILKNQLDAHFFSAKNRPGAHDRVEGMDHLDKLICIDQSPIGRTPRSNPATYTGVFGPIRDLFSQTPEAKMRGFKPGRFSFNVKGGRCETCEGDGVQKIEMHFLADVFVTCDICKGKRYNPHTLEVTYKGHSIADVLGLTINRGVTLFENIPAIYNKLIRLQEVGLGYIQLGQSATTLSGGEAQRVKLAKELSKKSTGSTLYILDEPTTGLHFDDVNQLLTVLHQLVEKGNTMIIIEHNLDVLKTADTLIDMGPEGGDKGGQVVAVGTPEEIAAHPQSHTGEFLKGLL